MSVNLPSINVGESEKGEGEVDSGITSLQSMAGEFNRENALRLQDEEKKRLTEENKNNIDTDKESEPVSSIDYSCFDRLNDDSFANSSEEQRAEVLAQCEQAYDASLEEFAGLGEFADPEIGRHNGKASRGGMDGAKRGVNYIVQCAINVEYYKKQTDKLESELAEHAGFHLFGRKKNETAKSKISEDLRQARSELEHAQKWPDRIGELAFGSMEKWQSDEIQSKYRHMIQMKKDIRRVKYPWTANEK